MRCWGCIGAAIVMAFGGCGEGPQTGAETSAADTAATDDPATTNAAMATSASSDATASIGDTTARDDDANDDLTTSDDDTTGSRPRDCPARGLVPGMHTGLALVHDGDERRYDVYVPRGYTGTVAVPLVFDFHGYLGSAAGQAAFSQIVPAADAAGTVIVLPHGIGSSWNGGACCGQAASENIDDVGFIRALVDEMRQSVCFDPARVFAMGMSNGGYMSNRLGCEAADIFAAIGPVAGMIQIPFDTCQPSRPVPVMHFHGTADLIVPYDGGGLNGYPSVAASMAVWIDRNGCTDRQPAITYQQGAVTCETWSECDAGSEVTLCTIEGMGHCWPGNLDCPFGASTGDISATNQLLGFFAAHPM